LGQGVGHRVAPRDARGRHRSRIVRYVNNLRLAPLGESSFAR
jgi:hypothetical protein